MYLPIQMNNTINHTDVDYEDKIKQVWLDLNNPHMSLRFNMIVEIYSSGTCEKAIMEWMVIGDDDTTGDTTKYYDFCICSHEIIHNFVIEHKYNGNTLVVGSECV